MDKFDLVRFTDKDFELDVRADSENETVWLTKEEMALLFDVDRTRIVRHINNIYADGELSKESTCAENAHMGSLGLQTYKTKLYNLDMIISVGYRVRSQRGILFRKWANKILKEYLLKGYVINKERTLVTNENYINLINKVNGMDDRLHTLEEESSYFPKKITVFENKVFDAQLLISDLISRAKTSIVLIDSYIDFRTLDVLKNKIEGVSITAITSSKANISQLQIDTFNNDYGELKVFINDNYHDRYLIIDDNFFYHLGSSINYLGKSFSQITKIVDIDTIELLRNRVK